MINDLAEQTIVEPLCFACKRLLYWPQCLAFPGGIPDEIKSGKNLHREPYPGDHGLQFLPWDEKDETPKGKSMVLQFNDNHDGTSGRFTSKGSVSTLKPLESKPLAYPESAEERLATASHADVKQQMAKDFSEITDVPSKIVPLTGKVTPKSAQIIGDNARAEIGRFTDYLAGETTHLLNRYVNQVERDLTKYSDEFKTVSARNMDALVRDSVQKMVYQEVESNRQQFTDHGIRHVVKDMEMQRDFMNALEGEGTPITGRERLLAQFVMVNHDVGYATPLIRGGGETGIKASRDHPAMSEKILGEQQRLWDENKIFTKAEFDRAKNIVRTHDDPSTDSSDRVALATRLADNMSLFQKEKLPSMFRYVKGGRESLVAMGKATKANDMTAFDGERQKLLAAVQRSGLSATLKRDLSAGVGEINKMTAKFSMGALAGEVASVSGGKKGSVVSVKIKFNEFDKVLQENFDMGQKQLKKFLETYGVSDFTQKRYKIGTSGSKALVDLEVLGAP